jgi:hypothetical protein
MPEVKEVKTFFGDMSIAKTGKAHTEEHNKNIGKGLIGKNKGKERSEEFKENVRRFQTGRKKSEETKTNISRSCQGRIPWNKGKKLKN